MERCWAKMFCWRWWIWCTPCMLWCWLWIWQADFFKVVALVILVWKWNAKKEFSVLFSLLRFQSRGSMLKATSIQHLHFNCELSWVPSRVSSCFCSLVVAAMAWWWCLFLSIVYPMASSLEFRWWFYAVPWFFSYGESHNSYKILEIFSYRFTVDCPLLTPVPYRNKSLYCSRGS